MLDDERYYLDHAALRARGWTRGLAERFLGSPDRWATVSHWLNYKGKATYFLERVMQVERSDSFKQAYAASLKRRAVPPESASAFQEERARLDAEYRDWLKSLNPEDVRTQLVADAAAAIFEEARAQGYRTPHK